MSQKKKIFKILILGDSGATVGADFMSKDVLVDDKQVSLQIWDTAGQDRFQALGAAFYRGTDCCVLVYDITDPKSFEDLEEWRREFINQGSPSNPDTFPFIIIGNKVDKIDQRKVSEEKAKNWCKTAGKTPMDYFECSAKDATNVDQAFTIIAKQAANQEKDDMIFEPGTVKLNQTKPQKQQKQSGCC